MKKYRFKGFKLLILSSDDVAGFLVLVRTGTKLELEFRFRFRFLDEVKITEFLLPLRHKSLVLLTQLLSPPSKPLVLLNDQAVSQV